MVRKRQTRENLRRNKRIKKKEKVRKDKMTKQAKLESQSNGQTELHRGPFLLSVEIRSKDFAAIQCTTVLPSGSLPNSSQI